jgi:hypothetical protein
VEHGLEVAALERLRRRASPEHHGALRLVACFEVGGERDRIALPDALEPLARALVSAPTVALGEHRVGGLGEQPVAEGPLLLSPEPPAVLARQDLAVAELREPRSDLRDGRAVVEERHHAARPEGLAEHARGSEHAPCLRLERLDAPLRHRDHRARQAIAVALGDASNELLEVEGVAARGGHDAGDRGVVREVVQHLPHEPLARLARELPEAHLAGAVFRP